MKKILFFVAGFLFCMHAGHLQAQTAGDYRSIKGGAWQDPATWQTFNGLHWQAAVNSPTFTQGKTSVRKGDTVTTAVDVMTDEVVVDKGGLLWVKFVSASSRLILH